MLQHRPAVLLAAIGDITVSFSFDFTTTAPFTFTTAAGTTVSNSADGVTFTLSGDADGGDEFLWFGNNLFPTSAIIVGDEGSDDRITLTFKSDLIAGNTRINGDATDPINMQWGFVNGTWQIAFLTSTGSIVPMGSQFLITRSEDNQSFSFGTGVGFVGTGITGIVFTSTNGLNGSVMNVLSLTGSAFNCFCAGTRIATPTGEVAVENLTAGDEVTTADGQVRTVTWLGRQSVDVWMGDPRKINPICITAGALGENLPQRDLWVSQDHAIELDGYLVNAGALVNGSTIYQVAQMPVEGFTYYHVETNAHELLLAEGCAAESFVDYSTLDSFDNAKDREDKVIGEMPLPRISAARMLPRSIKELLASVNTRAA